MPGRATQAEVEALMGQPALRVERGGEVLLYYPRGPSGWHSYVARIGADGRLVALEQRLTEENVARVKAGVWTREEVRELLGPPFAVSVQPRLGREVWEYQFLDVAFKWSLWVQFSADGVVREVLQMRHQEMDHPSGDSTRD